MRVGNLRMRVEKFFDFARVYFLAAADNLPNLEGWMHPRPVTWIDPAYPNGELMPRTRAVQQVVR